MMRLETTLLALKQYAVLFALLIPIMSIADTQNEDGWQRVPSAASESVWWKRISEDIAIELKQNPTYLRERAIIVTDKSTAFNQQLLSTLAENELTQKGGSADPTASSLSYTMTEQDDALNVGFRYGNWEYNKIYKTGYKTISSAQGWQKKIVAGDDS